MTRRLADKWLVTPADARGELLREYAATWGVDVSTLRRRLKTEHGLSAEEPSEERRRESYIPDEDARTVSMLIAKSIRRDHTGLPVEQAIEIAWREGLLKSERMPATSSMTRRMRELEINPERLVAPTPHVRLRSLHANHVHQLDASLCIQYRFNRSGLAMRYVDLNKLLQVKDVTQAVHRWVLADHLSGAFVVQYYDSPGERVEDMVRFLHWAWSPKQDARIPFCGVPKILYCDRGSAFVSHALQHLCKAYGVQLLWHEAGNAQATGSAESSHWVFERKFEARLRLQKIHTVEELIEKATLESLSLNRLRIHSRHQQTRFAAWEAAVPRPVSVPVEDLDQFAWLAHGRREERKVSGDGLISYAAKKQGARYFHVADAAVGQLVTVVPHPYEVGRIKALNKDGQELVVTPVEKDQWGFVSTAVTFGEYARLPETPAQKVIEAAADLPELSRAFLDSSDMPAEVYEAAPIPYQSARTGQEVLKRVVMLDRFEAKARVCERLGRPLTRDEGAWWNEQIGDAIEDSALEEALQTWLAPDGASALVRVA